MKKFEIDMTEKKSKGCVKLFGEGCTIYDVYDIAVKKATVELDAEQMEQVEQCYLRVQKWGAARYPIYGVNTGFGELINVIIPPKFKNKLQCNLLRSHAAGSGDSFPDDVVRAIIAVRLNCLLKGHSGVSPQAVELLKEFLNRGIHPIIPQQGSLGASGDLAPLSHLALTLIGEGQVRVNGLVKDTAEVFELQGLKPIKPGFKEALSLINGTSAMTGVASMALVNSYQLLKMAILGTVDILQCLGGSTRPFDSSGHLLKNHSGQIVVARELKRNLKESILTREHSDIMKSISEQVGDTDQVADTDIYLQNAYSLRCIPQVLGPVLDTINFCRKIVEDEINSANDNPLFFNKPEETFHGGNFHGQYVSMACDYLNIALTEIGVLAERQLDRLLSPHLNGNLPDFLAAGDSGLYCGFEGGQYLATSIASENLNLAAPSSIKSIPSNGANQDIVSMGLISARKSLQLCDHLTTILSVLFGACHQASLFIGLQKFNHPVRKLHEGLSGYTSLYADDYPISRMFSDIREYLSGNELWEEINSLVNLNA